MGWRIYKCGKFYKFTQLMRPIEKEAMSEQVAQQVVEQAQKAEQVATTPNTTPRFKAIKEQRLEAILKLFKECKGAKLTVEDISQAIGLEPKTCRKYLRLLRKELGNELIWVKTSTRLVYVYQPKEETVKELQIAASVKKSKKAKKAKKTKEVAQQKEVEVVQ
jgi:response regulator of citrate/malate metabolism